MKRMLIGLVVSSVVAAPALEAVTPPGIVNYQGVLLDNVGGGPENGDRDMIFHLYDADVGGNEILRDKHLLAPGGMQVSVMMGLFNVQIGTGVIEDGTGPNVYDSLDKVFADFQAVYLEVEVRVGPAGGAGVFETLSPRTRFVSSPYALNAKVASSLDGLMPGDFIDTSATPQTKAGNLTVADLALNGNTLLFNNGAQVNTTSPHVLRLTAPENILFTAGNSLADGNITILAGDSPDDGQIDILPNGHIELRAANGIFNFVNGDSTLETAALDPNGNLQIDGGLTAAAGPTFPNASFTIAGVTGIAGETRIRHAAAGSTGQTNGTLLAPTSGTSSPGTNGSIIETNVLGESAGIFLNSDSIALWSPGDQGRLLSVYDEDLLTPGDPASVVAAERFSIDGVGGVSMDGSLIVGGPLISLGTDPNGVSPTIMQHINFMGLQILTTRTFETVETNLDRDNNNLSEMARWCTNGSCTGANQLMQLQANGNLLIGGTLFQNQFDLAEAYRKGEELEPGDVVRIDPIRKGTVVRAMAGDQGVLGVISTYPGVVLGGTPMSAEALEAMWGDELKELFLAEKDGLIAQGLAAEPEWRLVLSQLEKNVSWPRAAASPAGSSISALRGIAPSDKDESELAARQQESEWRRDMTSVYATLETKALEAFYERHFAPVALAGRVPVKVDAQYGTIAVGDALAPSPIPGVAMKDDGHGTVIGIALEGFAGGRGKVEAFIARSQGVSPEIAGRTRELAEQVERRTPDPATGVQALAGHLQIVLDQDGDDEARLSVFRDGQGEDGGAEVFRVDEEGNVFAKGSFRPNSMDVAELFALGEPAGPGDVLAADPERPGRFRPAREESDATVIGVVASRPGLLLGGGVDRILAADALLAAQLAEARRVNERQAEARIWRQLESSFAETHAAVAMTGTVLVKADAGYGAIRAGDLLCSSPTPGHAMRSDDPLPGTILGKALESLESGIGAIRVLVMMR